MRVIKIKNYTYIGYKKKSDVIRPIYIDNIKTQYSVTIDGKVFNRKNMHELSKCNSNCGYHMVLIYYDGKRKTCYVHRLVADAFIKVPKKYLKNGLTKMDLTINHIDGDKTNNRVENLEWNTYQENIQHAVRNGLTHPRHGEAHPFAKLTEEQVKEISTMIQNNDDTILNIARKFNVDRHTIKKIYNRECWKDITKNYDFSNFNKTRTVDKKLKHHVIDLIKSSGKTCKEISKETGLSYSYVWHLAKCIK